MNNDTAGGLEKISINVIKKKKIIFIGRIRKKFQSNIKRRNYP